MPHRTFVQSMLVRGRPCGLEDDFLRAKAAMLSARLSYRNSDRPSVRPSVRLSVTRVD